jgi:hypothetical protein
LTRAITAPTFFINRLGESPISRKTKEPVKINLRLEPELHRQLQEATEQHGTSLQTEITRRLEESFNPIVPGHVQNIIKQTATAVATAVVEGKWMVVGGEASNERKKARPASTVTKTTDEGGGQTNRKAP